MSHGGSELLGTQDLDRRRGHRAGQHQVGGAADRCSVRQLLRGRGQVERLGVLHAQAARRPQRVHDRAATTWVRTRAGASSTSPTSAVSSRWTTWPTPRRPASCASPPAGPTPAGPAQIASTPRGHAIAVWSIESPTRVGNRLYFARVLLPGLGYLGQQGWRGTISGPVSCQPASTIAGGVKGSRVGWKVGIGQPDLWRQDPGSEGGHRRVQLKTPGKVYAAHRQSGVRQGRRLEHRYGDAKFSAAASTPDARTQRPAAALAATGDSRVVGRLLARGAQPKLRPRSASRCSGRGARPGGLR